MSHATRGLLLLLALTAIAGLAACGGGSEGKAADGESVATIVFRDGKPVGGVRNLEYEGGERIRFQVRSDVARVVYVHLYELKKRVPAGGSVSFSFPANEPGLFAVYVEKPETQIAEIMVNQ